MAVFLDAVNVASIAIILAVVIDIGRETLLDWRAVLIALVSLIATFYFKKLNTAFIVVGGALMGYLLSYI